MIVTTKNVSKFFGLYYESVTKKRNPILIDEDLVNATETSMGANVLMEFRRITHMVFGLPYYKINKDKVGTWINYTLVDVASVGFGKFRVNDSNFFSFKDKDKICILENPKVRLDSENRFHSVTDASIEFEDMQFYHIHGVSFGIKSSTIFRRQYDFKKQYDGKPLMKKLISPFLSDVNLWKKITERKLTVWKLLSLTNIEQRRVALEYYGPEIIFESLKPKLIDKSSRGNKLWKCVVEVPQNNNTRSLDLVFLEYGCPSTERKYISFVEPRFTKADEAMAWKHNMTETEYDKLKIET